MAKAKQLPSKSWHVKVYDYTDENGKRHYEPFTAPTEDEANFLAAEFKLKKKRKANPANMTVRQAIDRYIEIKSKVLAVDTIREYKQERRNHLQLVMDVPLKNLTQELVQEAVNHDALTLANKTIRNAHGLLSAVLGVFRPDFALTKTTFPQEIKAEIYVPEQEEVNTLMAAVLGTPLELPILLSAATGMRRSEICGLRWARVNLNAGKIYIDQAMVKDEHKQWCIKPPKTAAGYRSIDLPPFLIDRLRAESREGEYVIGLSPDRITNRFGKLVKRLGLDPRLHYNCLRHYHASIMLALNVPNKYAQKRMGHKSDHMLKKVYQHLMEAKKSEVSESINNYLQREMQHNTDETA